MEKPLGKRFVEDAKANKCSRSLDVVLEKADASKYRRWPIRSPPLHQKYRSDGCSEDIPCLALAHGPLYIASDGSQIRKV